MHCVGGSWGAEFHEGLVVDAGPVVWKGTGGEDGYSGFSVADPRDGARSATELDGLLRERGVGQVVVVGLATDYCVKETVLDALRLGYEATVLRDCVAAVDLEPGDGEAALAEMQEAGAEISA